MDAQNEVVSLLLSKKIFDEQSIRAAVDWFFNHLGMPVQYFANLSNADISSHIQSLMVTIQRVVCVCVCVCV